MSIHGKHKKNIKYKINTFEPKGKTYKIKPYYIFEDLNKGIHRNANVYTAI